VRVPGDESPGREREDTISELSEEQPEELEEIVDLDEIEVLTQLNFEVGDSVVYPHHGAGHVIKREMKSILGEDKEYLTIKILHNDMTVMVPTDKVAQAGLRRVVSEETLEQVIAVLQAPCNEIPGNWSRRYKHNREKVKTGDITDLAEVVRNLGVREHDKGLSTGEKQMFTRAKKILCSEMQYALDMDEDEVDVHIMNVILDGHDSTAAA